MISRCCAEHDGIRIQGQKLLGVKGLEVTGVMVGIFSVNQIFNEIGLYSIQAEDLSCTALFPGRGRQPQDEYFWLLLF